MKTLVNILCAQICCMVKVADRLLAITLVRQSVHMYSVLAILICYTNISQSSNSMLCCYAACKNSRFMHCSCYGLKLDTALDRPVYSLFNTDYSIQQKFKLHLSQMEYYRQCQMCDFMTHLFNVGAHVFVQDEAFAVGYNQIHQCTYPLQVFAQQAALWVLSERPHFLQRAFGNSGNGKLKRKTEMVKMKMVYFLTHNSLQRPPVVHVSISHRL